MHVLTTKGYVDASDPSNRLYKYVAIGDNCKPHICIDTEDADCVEITFLSGMQVTLPDHLSIETYENGSIEIPLLSFGVKIALVDTPQSIVNSAMTNPAIKSLIYDLINLIKTNGKKRQINDDAHHCDITVNWTSDKLDSFIYGLSSLGIYIKVRSRSKSDSKLLSVNSETLNLLTKFANDEDLALDVFKQPNIDCQRDRIEIIKSIKKIKSLSLKTHSGIDYWDSLVIDGFLVETKCSQSDS